MRTPLVGGNWKMNTDRASATALARAVSAGVARDRHAEAVDVAVFPPFPYLIPCAEALRENGTAVWLGAQDCSSADAGAFTGEVSARMLADCGVGCVLAGHSERRHVIGESDDVVNAKLRAALAGGLRVVLCVGETLDQRQGGQTSGVIERQARLGLRGVSPESLPHLSIAYEPVWAIGTGKVASPADAQEAHAHLRAVIAEVFGPAAAAALRIIYGGSVTAGNAPGLMAMPDVDGGLIGGASLKPEEFLGIVAAAAWRAARVV